MRLPKHCVPAGVSLLLATTSLPAGEAAWIRVKGNRPIVYGVLKESVRVNSDRDYTIAGTPKEIRGLHYVLHQHKAPADVTIDVTQGGEIHLCLVEGVLPTQLGLECDWKPAGKVNVIAPGKPYAGTIHRTSVKTGDKMVVRSANKWGSMILAKQVEGIAQFVPGKTTSVAKSGSGGQVPVQDGELGQLQRQIAESRKWNRARLEKEVARPEALILDSDKTRPEE
jgi:hypothetical protein